jgi:hypothetical protein
MTWSINYTGPNAEVAEKIRQGKETYNENYSDVAEVILRSLDSYAPDIKVSVYASGHIYMSGNTTGSSSSFSLTIPAPEVV